MVKVEPAKIITLTLNQREAQALYDYLGCLSKTDVAKQIEGSIFQKMDAEDVDNILDEIFDALDDSDIVTSVVA